MLGDPTRAPADRRALSEVLGMVMLFGLITAAAVMVLVMGGTATDRAVTDQQAETAQKAALDMKTDLQSMVIGGTVDSASVDYSVSGRTTIESGDQLSITVNGMSECSATAPLSRLRYESQEGGTLVYQAGAVWQETDSGLSMLSPPSVGFDNGTLKVTAVEFTGATADHRFELVENSQRSWQRSREISRELFDRQECYRPSNITLVVESPKYSRLWYDYLKNEMPATVGGSDLRHDPSTGRVTVVLDETELPTRSDDHRNQVVNLTDGQNYNGWVDDSSDTIMVDKGTNASYRMSATLLGTHSGFLDSLVETETRYVRIVKNSTQWKALNVVFAIDESCSMNSHGCPETGNGPNTQIAESKDAARFLITKLQNDTVNNSSVNHSAALVAFPGDGDGTASDPPDGGSPGVVYKSLSRNLGAVKSEVSNMGDLDFSTPVEGGINKAKTLLSGGNSSRKDVLVMIFDGKPTNPRWKQAAKQASRQGVFIHAIGFGAPSDIDQSMVRELANISGGKAHFARTKSGLKDIFRDIKNTSMRSIRKPYTIPKLKDRQIKHPVIELKMKTGSETFYPWVDGDSGIAFTREIRESLRINDSDGVEVVALQTRECNNFTATNDTDSFGGNWWDLPTMNYTIPGTNNTSIHDSWKSTEFTHYKCTDVGPVIRRATTPEIYVDGDPLPSSSSTSWWEEGVADIVPDKYKGGGEFQLADNQVIVFFPSSDNNAVFLVGMGNDPTRTYTKDIVNVNFAEVAVEDE